MLKTRRTWDSLIFNIGIPIWEGDIFILRRPLGCMLNLTTSCDMNKLSPQSDRVTWCRLLLQSDMVLHKIYWIHRNKHMVRDLLWVLMLFVPSPFGPYHSVLSHCLWGNHTIVRCQLSNPQEYGQTRLLNSLSRLTTTKDLKYLLIAINTNIR